MLQLMTIDQRNKYGTKLQLTKLSEKYLTMRVSERRVVVVNVVVVVVNSNLCQSSFFSYCANSFCDVTSWNKNKQYWLRIVFLLL